MSNLNTEITEVTKLVLYGWGYPDLFNSQTGKPLQNRLVKFSAQALPVIEAAGQDTFMVVLPKLEMIRRTYLNRLNQEAGSQPLWVWIERPKRLSSSEIINYQKKFEDWVERVAAPKLDRLQLDRLQSRPLIAKFSAKFPTKFSARIQAQPLQDRLTRWFLESWRIRVVAIAVIAAITLSLIHFFSPPMADQPVGLMASESSGVVDKIIP
jgi:hypothetical protein